MNRYKSGGPSKASATTLCQKCLQRGHYSYECTAAQQERPYVSRPSRTQQLLNPKLAPKITESAPPKPPEREDQASDRSKVFGGTTNDTRKRSRSASSYTSDSDSVSSISTNNSRSRSRSRSHVPDATSDAAATNPASSRQRIASPGKHGQDSRSRSPRQHRASTRHRRRESRSQSRSTYRDRRDDSHTEDTDRRGPARRDARERSLSPYSKRLALSRGTA